MKRSSFEFRFVEYIPKQPEEGVLYVSVGFATASHRCFCGCGMKVVTPLSPTDWRLIFNGDTISLEPSVGNWSYPCRSHYVLRGNRVLWAGAMSQARIDTIRAWDREAKARYFAGGSGVPIAATEMPQAATQRPAPPDAIGRETGPWSSLLDWLSRWNSRKR